jgi:hypothetical protein
MFHPHRLGTIFRLSKITTTPCFSVLRVEIDITRAHDIKVMRKLRLISAPLILFLAFLDTQKSWANDRINITGATEPKVLDKVSTVDFSVKSAESLKAILKSKEAVQELVKELRSPQPAPAGEDSGEDRKEVIDRYEILSLPGDGKIQVLVFTYFQSSNPRYEGGFGAESLILTIYKEGGSIRMNEYEDCPAQSSKQVIDDFNHDGRHEILEGCMIFGYRGGGQSCNACAHVVVYHILGFQDGKIVHAENEFRNAYSKIVLPILNADLIKSEGGRADKESLGIAMDFLSSSVPKGTSSKCPVERFISKPKRRLVPEKE